MEASSSACWKCNSIVREPLDDDNYEIWSSCMKDYLLGQDLWDIIEPELEPADQESVQSSSDSKTNSIKCWRKKNALALHAIKLSCGPKLVSKVLNEKSARHAWILLADRKAVGEEQSTNSDNEIEEEDDGIDYEPFVKAVTSNDWNSMREFIESCPQAAAARVFFGGCTALHYKIYEGDLVGANSIARIMSADQLKITDENGYTYLAVGALKWNRLQIMLLRGMVLTDPHLPNIGTPSTLPVIIAAWKGIKDTARYLYRVTDMSILSPDNGVLGVTLLVHCIQNKIFDIAMKLVEKFPHILRQQDVRGIYPIHALAKIYSTFARGSEPTKSSRLKPWRSDFRVLIMKYIRSPQGPIPTVFNEEENIRGEVRSLLFLVCEHVAALGHNMLIDAVYNAMVEAAIRGNIEFITEMLAANPDLIWAHQMDGSMFVHAIKNRREKVFSLLYAVFEKKDQLLNCVNKEKNNIIHLAAILAPSHVLDRTSSPALQVQKEFQWFQEVWNVADPQEREEYNNDGLTPRELFAKSHESLIDAGEKSVKDTAQSSTVVGAFIASIMFAAFFTTPGGNNQDTGYPLFANEVVFKIFILCDALSLYSSTSSVLIFLEILTSRYIENDFLLSVPRKLMLGLSALFFSIITMMITFCAAMYIVYHRRLLFILPIILLAFVPIILFLTSIFPLLFKICKSTFGPSIFKRNTALPQLRVR